MFESAELGHQVDKTEYEKREPKLRADLLDSQFDVREAKQFPVIVLIGGLEGTGKGELVNQLHNWLDGHYLRSHALDAPTDEERERPPMWRFWRRLAPKGSMAIFLNGWYGQPLAERVAGKLRRREFRAAMERAARFEEELVKDGAVVVKFWLHLSKKAQRKRLKRLSKDPLTAWRVTEADREAHRAYARWRATAAEALEATSTGDAPWIVVDAEDARYRDLYVGEELVAAMKRGLAAHKKRRAPAKLPRPPAAVDGVNALTALDLDRTISSDKYEAELIRLQARLNQLVRSKRFEQHALVMLFEGPDAAGKGGAIERVTAALDARHFHIVPVSAPSEAERAHPYLWRFWRQLPRLGHTAIFDRSWYGRVLVERVEGFASVDAWMRAYGEINDFEQQLDAHGTVLVKFWLQISKGEQLKRFKERQQVSFKRYKITKEDWRNREKWDAYQTAAAEMIDRTSTLHAPWELVPATDKHYARIQVLKTLCKQLEKRLGK